MNADVWRRWLALKRRTQVATAALIFALIGTISSSAADISYIYDDAGRLQAVIDPASDTAVYAYDAVGNLTGITRQPSPTLAVLQFTPSSSPIGTTVTIYGTGFSATPASNIVKFNGTTATVLTASTTVLTAKCAERRHHRLDQRDGGSEHGHEYGILYCRLRGADAGRFHPSRRELWGHDHPDRHQLRHHPDQ